MRVLDQAYNAVFIRTLPGCTAALFLIALCVAASVFPATAVDLELLNAYHTKNVQALQRYAKTNKVRHLEPYLIAWTSDEREVSEGKLAPELVRALDLFAGVPPIEELRATALKAWARKGDWDRFARHVDQVPDWIYEQDKALSCAKIAFLRSRRLPYGELRQDLFAQLWEFPAPCEKSFAGAVATGDITPRQVVLKLMHLASLGKVSEAERLLASLSPELGERSFPQETGAKMMEVFRIARKDYRKGIQSLEQQRHHFDSETARDVTLHLGVIGARNLEPHAHALIKSVDGYLRPLSPAAAEWRTRAALLAGAWDDVAASLENMPASLRDEAVWKYWRARSFEHLSRTQESRNIYGALSRQPGYYGLLAAERLGQEPPYLSGTSVGDSQLPREFESRPEVQRAIALHKAGLWVEAARELNILFRGADSSTFYAGALFAQAKGLPDRQISFASRATDHIDLPLRYPLFYQQEVFTSAERTRLSPGLLWAVIRQESRFIPHALSPAGAVGLMQVMPATAKRISGSRSHSRRISRDSLMAPYQNISLGSGFLKALCRRYDGNHALAAAAYNAGPGRVDGWQRHLAGIEIERFIELIPFTETRDYTKQVLANYVLYAYVLGEKPISLMSLGARRI